MPKSYHSAGKSTRDMAEGRRSRAVSVGLLTIGALVVLYLLMSNSTSLGIGGIGILVLVVAMRLVADQFDNYARRQEKAIRRADRGAVAEEEVGDLLDELDDSFVVINDVESPYGNIDHVVLSQKGGIYLIETKSHHGTVTTYRRRDPGQWGLTGEGFCRPGAAEQLLAARRDPALVSGQPLGHAAGGVYQRLCQIWPAGERRARHQPEISAADLAIRPIPFRGDSHGMGKPRTDRSPLERTAACFEPKGACCYSLLLPEMREDHDREGG